jgi:hypothetical protein
MKERLLRSYLLIAHGNFFISFHVMLPLQLKISALNKLTNNSSRFSVSSEGVSSLRTECDTLDCMNALLTTRKREVLQKLIVVRLIWKTKSSNLLTRVPTGPYPEFILSWYTLSLRLILMLSYDPRLGVPSGLFFKEFPINNVCVYCPSQTCYMRHAPNLL